MLILLRNHGAGVVPPTPPDNPGGGHSISRRHTPHKPTRRPTEPVRLPPAHVWLTATLEPATASFDVSFSFAPLIEAEDEELLLLLT